MADSASPVDYRAEVSNLKIWREIANCHYFDGWIFQDFWHNKKLTEKFCLLVALPKVWRVTTPTGLAAEGTAGQCDHTLVHFLQAGLFS